MREITEPFLKKLLVMLIVSMCAIAWRSPDILHAIGVAGAAQDPAAMVMTPLNAAQSAPQPISIEEFAKLNKTDPLAYQKFINSHQVQERGEIDKLLNFLARGRYE